MKSRSALLAKSITCASSKQSYLTARLMVDKDLVEDCYRAYGYFRWADDVVDVKCQTREERLTFIRRQIDLADQVYRGDIPDNLCLEEEILADLILNDQGMSNRLRSYIDNFLAIIEFDAERKGRLVSQDELDWYSETLGKAVTDGIQYFICNDHPYPESESRYLAAQAAHIVHMLRDCVEDIPEGYFNIPAIALKQNGFQQLNLESGVIRDWVRSEVRQARTLFEAGKKYLDQLEVLRCKIVGYWYCARFERIIDQIEQDSYVLRAEYKKPAMLPTWVKFAGIALSVSFWHIHVKWVEKIRQDGRQPGRCFSFPPIRFEEEIVVEN